MSAPYVQTFTPVIGSLAHAVGKTILSEDKGLFFGYVVYS